MALVGCSIACDHATNAVTCRYRIAQADQKNDGYWQPYLVAGLIYSPTSNLDLDIGFKYQKKTLSTERQIGIGMAWRF
jgi:opacity protein-like surface antigen